MNHYSYSMQGQRRRRGNYGGRSELVSVLLFYVLPFIAVNALIFFLMTTKPICEMTVGDTNDYRTTTVTLKVKSFLPYKEPVASLDGQPVELVKTGKKTYMVELSTNGVLEVDLIGLNKMSSVSFEHINILDDNPPEIFNNVIENDILTFQMEDTQSGIDFNSIYGATDDSVQIMPLSVDRTTGTVSFEMKWDVLNVFAKDLSGNEVRATFNSNGSASAESTTGSPAASQESAGASGESESAAQ